MSTALYRKYRSGTFAELVGQDHIGATLRNQVRAGAPAHAYLFAGIRGTGKTSTARILARAVNCAATVDGEPCNACPACREILGGGSVDVLEIDAASNRGIDEMRDLREKVKFLPASLRRKVYIIDEAHMLTTEAWNAFLKTLEEPPEHVLFILATTEAHKVPETVRSRVQRFDFRRVGRADVARHLATIAAAEQVAIEPAALELLSRAGQGSVRDALSLLDQSLASGERPVTAAAVRRALGLADPETLWSLLGALAAADAAGALRAAAAAFEGGADARQLLREAGRLARASEMCAVGYPEASDVAGEDLDLCRRLAAVAAPGFWVEALERFGETEIALRQPVDARLQVELCLLRLCRGSAEGAGAALAGRVAALEALVRDGRAAVIPAATLPARASDPVAHDDEARLPTAAGTGPSAAGTGSIAAGTGAAGTGSPAAGPAVPTSPAEEVGRAAASGRPGSVTAGPDGAPVTPPAVPAAAEDSADRIAEPTTGHDTAGSPAAEPAGVRLAPPADAAAWTALWPAVVDAVARRDAMLAGVLRSCHVDEGGPGHLVIAAPFGFHLERLREKVKARLLADVVAGLVGEACTVEAVFRGEDQRRSQTPAFEEVDATREALAVFPGSRIVGSRLRDTARE